MDMTEQKRKKWNKKVWVGSVFLLLSYAFIKHFTSHAENELPPPTVVIQKPKLTKVTDYVTQTGTVVAYNAVNLVARIEGYLDNIEFTDGTFVKKGKELFVIEPQPYLEKLKAAQASVEVQRANYNYSKSEYERQKKMYKQNATSLNNVEKWSAKTDESKAEIAKYVADATVAAINYSYTHILAPFDGRIGRHLIDIGNLVGNGKATNLATIEQIDPIYVYFNLNELDLIKVRDIARSESFNPANLNQIPVYVRLQNESKFIHEGRLNFVNTGLNASTGTMEFRALLKNKDYLLLPGLFVEVRIPVGKPTPQLTIPDSAIQYDQIGAYVYVVTAKHLVVVKRVVIGALDQGVRAIIKGLKDEDEVIVSGVQNATPGNPVSPIVAENK